MKTSMEMAQNKALQCVKCVGQNLAYLGLKLWVLLCDKSIDDLPEPVKCVEEARESCMLLLSS